MTTQYPNIDIRAATLLAGSPGDSASSAMQTEDPTILRVTYMELHRAPPAAAQGDRLSVRAEQIAREQLNRETYLHLYRRVGEPLRWDQRLRMPEGELAALLAGGSLDISVLRDARAEALGFCEFDRREFPSVELTNFGLVPEAQGRGLGPWLLAVALLEQWKSNPSRIWLHTDTWDHAAAVRVYERAGFRVYDVRDEPAGPL
jgi:GNAT superfamily N-acetyltransferase